MRRERRIFVTCHSNWMYDRANPWDASLRSHDSGIRRRSRWVGRSIVEMTAEFADHTRSSLEVAGNVTVVELP